jgi:hypothetical protein
MQYNDNTFYVNGIDDILNNRIPDFSKMVNTNLKTYDNNSK